MDFATMEMIADAKVMSIQTKILGERRFTRGQIVDDALGNNLGGHFLVSTYGIRQMMLYIVLKSYDTATSYQKLGLGINN